MQHQAGKICGWTLAVVCSASVAAGQAAGARNAQTIPVLTNPHYESITLEISVNRPAAEVWKRVGKFCDIAEPFQLSCKIISGKDGEVGAVRFLGSAIGNEILVGKTDLSYTYAQPLKPGQPYDLYHGTVEARPLTATASKLVYTLLYDNSRLPDEAAREKDKAQRSALFTRGLSNMKSLAETGTMPPTSTSPR
jgi:Polyketide cyclase / dehydrase and lipid transport